MRDELLIDFTVSNENKFRPFKEKNKGFLQIFSVQKFYSPELIWNDDTRSELLEVLQY
jgi:hypothetical protein